MKIWYQRFSARTLLYAIITGLMGGIWLIPQPALAASPTYGSCQTVRHAVALAPGQPANQTISGQLCTPRTWASGAHQVDIMVHGATYNRKYWDFPLNQTTYSYVDATLQAGRASFAYDRLGAGDSSHPLGTAVTVPADAYVLHQLIGWLKANYSKTTVIGHSLGSLIAVSEAATYNDATRLVVTGYMHGTSLGLGLPQVFGSFYPAALDPQFLGLLDPTYLTTRPGTRSSAFYYAPTADPAVIAYDEAHKDLLSSTQLAQVPTELEAVPPLNTANRVKVPTLLVMGDHDALFCGLLVDCTQASKVKANEAPYYSSAASLDVRTVPNTGHDLTLHPSSHQSHAMIDAWIQTH